MGTSINLKYPGEATCIRFNVTSITWYMNLYKTLIDQYEYTNIRFLLNTYCIHITCLLYCTKKNNIYIYIYERRSLVTTLQPFVQKRLKLAFYICRGILRAPDEYGGILAPKQMRLTLKPFILIIKLSPVLYYSKGIIISTGDNFIIK